MANDRPTRTPIPPPTDPSDKDVCRYIAETLAELRALACRPRLQMIAYMLDSARVEAEKIAKGEGR